MPNSLISRLRSRGGPLLAISALALLLGGCPMFAIFIDLDAERQGDAVRFSDPNQGWLDSHCVRDLEVKDVPTGEIMWAASSRGSGCLVEVPFEYGAPLHDAKPGEYLMAKDLVTGTSYEVFVEFDNGAGDGTFVIGDSGAVQNTD